MENIKSEIRKFMKKKSGKKTFDDGDDLFKLGFVDSLYAFQLVLFIEKTFKVKVKNKEITQDNFRSINAIAQTVEKVMK